MIAKLYERNTFVVSNPARNVSPTTRGPPRALAITFPVSD